eukprot:403357690
MANLYIQQASLKGPTKTIFNPIEQKDLLPIFYQQQKLNPKIKGQKRSRLKIRHLFASNIEQQKFKNFVSAINDSPMFKNIKVDQEFYVQQGKNEEVQQILKYYSQILKGNARNKKFQESSVEQLQLFRHLNFNLEKVTST